MNFSVRAEDFQQAR